MEKLKEISRKYILDNDDERLMDALDKLGKVLVLDNSVGSKN